MDTLPVELLHEIASHDQAAYRALLAIPLFARSLNPGTIVDYKINFGYSIGNFSNDSLRDGEVRGKYIGWTLNGKLHRMDGPAIERKNGDKEWYRDGKLHREDSPAVECANGNKFWLRNGKCHRENGPAVEYYDGPRLWYKNGKCHREDGPAAEWPSGETEWYINGEFCSAEGTIIGNDHLDGYWRQIMKKGPSRVCRW